MIADEQPVSETEFDALPEHKDTCTEEQFVTAEDGSVDIEPAEVHTEPDNQNELTHFKTESPNPHHMLNQSMMYVVHHRLCNKVVCCELGK